MVYLNCFRVWGVFLNVVPTTHKANCNDLLQNPIYFALQSDKQVNQPGNEFHTYRNFFSIYQNKKKFNPLSILRNSTFLDKTILTILPASLLTVPLKLPGGSVNFF